MRKLTSLLVVLMSLSVFAAIAIAAIAADGEKKAVTNKKCPINGGEVNEKYRAEYNGQFVYFCCSGCVEDFKKNPEAAIAKLSAEDQAAIKINEKCQVSGEPISKALSVEYEGRKVYFCCEHCVEQFKKEHATR